MGHYEPQETCLLRTLLGQGGTFMDVGANWGYFSLLAAEQVGASGRVVSVEADPRMFSILKRNVEMNALPQVTLVPAAAAAGAGTLKLAGFDEEQSNWGISRVVSGGALPGLTLPAEPSGGGVSSTKRSAKAPAPVAPAAKPAPKVPLRACNDASAAAQKLISSAAKLIDYEAKIRALGEATQAAGALGVGAGEAVLDWGRSLWDTTKDLWKNKGFLGGVGAVFVAIAAGYGVRAYPNLWMIDPRGNVRSHHVGYGDDSFANIADEIRQLLNEEMQRQQAVAPAG
jgi:hypothetical protein